MTRKDSKAQPVPRVTVPTSAKKVRGTWSLHVDECPFCGREHWHGGGPGSRPSAGPRVAHCGTGHAGLYDLRIARVTA